MEVGRDDYLDARDRALQAVVSAKTFDKAQAAWRLAKAHNRCATEYYREGRAGLEVHASLAGHAQLLGGLVGREVKG